MSLERFGSAAVSECEDFKPGWYFIQADKADQDTVVEALREHVNKTERSLVVIDASGLKAFPPTIVTEEFPLRQRALEIAEDVMPLIRLAMEAKPDVIAFKGIGNGLFWVKLLNPWNSKFVKWVEEHDVAVVGIMGNRPKAWMLRATVAVEMEGDAFYMMKDKRGRDGG